MSETDFDALMRSSGGKKKAREPHARIPTTPSVDPELDFEALMRESDLMPPAEPEVASVAPPSKGLERFASVKKFRKAVEKGWIEPEAVRDLHNLNRKQAEAATREFLFEAKEQGWQTVRVIVGKGWRSQSGESVLQAMLPEWVAAHSPRPYLHVIPAPRRLGGQGAYIIYFGKARR